MIEKSFYLPIDLYTILEYITLTYTNKNIYSNKEKITIKT
jgi:hypothetical protein